MKTHRMPRTRVTPLLVAVAAVCAAAAQPADASSHREAPSITTTPKVDGTDFYMFNSYEAGRTGVRHADRELPAAAGCLRRPELLQARSERAVRDPRRQQRRRARRTSPSSSASSNTLSKHRADDRHGANAKSVADPADPVGRRSATPNATTLNVNETFTVDVVRGDRRTGTPRFGDQRGGRQRHLRQAGRQHRHEDDSELRQRTPRKHVYTVNIPGCTAPGKVFVGQRKDPFAVNLGVDLRPAERPGRGRFHRRRSRLPARQQQEGRRHRRPRRRQRHDARASRCRRAAWSPAERPGHRRLDHGEPAPGLAAQRAPKSGHQTAAITGGAWTQVSRLGMPLVNEVVIGLPDKDKFNGSKPKDDGQFADYVTNPTLPALVEIALATPGIAPTNFPRTDLVTTFLTGIAGVNQPKAFAAAPATGVASEMLRLNTAIAPTPEASQNRLGLLGGLLGPAAAGPRRLSERAAAERRRRRHLADRGDGRPVRGQRRCRCLQVRRGLQAERGTARSRGVRPARRRRPGRTEGQGQRAAAARLPVPRAADPRRDAEGEAHEEDWLHGSSARACCSRAAAAAGNDSPPPATSQVPASASASIGGFISYLQALVGSMADTLEPVDVGAVTPPADETSDPQVVD